MTLDEVKEAESVVCKNINFISEDQIKQSAWQSAQILVADIDPKDTHYIAYSNHFRCKLWSGDKVLAKGLTKKGFKKIITTDELFNLRQHKAR